MYQGINIKAGPTQANTRDIQTALARIVPAAAKQIEQLNFTKSGNPVSDAKRVAAYVQKNFKYVRDGLQNQNIKLPSALLKEKTGDCKSFALFIAAVLSSWGYKNGFRFAAYKGSTPTHVYNYVLDSENNVFTLDACLPDLQESKRATFVEDMEVRYLAGVPIMMEMDEGINGRKERQARRAKRRAEGKGFGQRAKKIGLAPGRGAFLSLILLNVRGLATKMSKLSPEKRAGFWGKLGGDKKKLEAAINKGKDKKPVLGMNGHGAYPEGEYIGVAAEAAAVAAAPIVIAAVKFLKDAGIDTKDVSDFINNVAPDAEPLGDFEATDPETPEAEALTKTRPGSKEGKEGPLSTEPAPGFMGNFKISPIMIGAALVGVYFLTKKKGRK